MTGPNYKNEVTLNAANKWKTLLKEIPTGTYTVHVVEGSATVEGYDLTVSGDGTITTEETITLTDGTKTKTTQTITNTYKHVDHVGGTATCQAQAVCTKCHAPYGDTNPDNHVGTLGDWQKSESEHWKVYSGCKHETTHAPHDYDADGKCECGAVQYTVTFDPNGGTVDTTTATTDTSGKLTSLPTPVRNGYQFTGWFTDKTGGTEVTEATIYTAHTIVYAHWTDTEDPVISGITNGKTYCEAQTVTVTDNGAIQSVTVNGNDITLGNDGKFTLTPAEGEQEIIVMDMDGNTATMTVTVNDGHEGGTATCQAQAACEHCSTPYGDKNPDNHVGTLGDWQTSESEHWKVYSGCKHETTHAPHDYDENGECICSMTQYIVTFDPNGGTVGTATATTDANGKLSSLPTPTQKNHNFLGWFTEDGEMITTDTIFTEHTTVYAQWQLKSSALLPTWQEWELIDKIVAANKKKDEPVETEPEVTEPIETEPVEDVEPAWENPFADVAETDAFYEAIKFAYENGYMNGMSSDTFAPNEGLTRGMLVTVLYRAAGSPVMDEANPFTDVAEDAWYYNAVVWAKSIGLINGITETEFAPENEITREQLVTIFYRYAEFLGYDLSVGEDTNILSYEDFADIAEYAIPALQWACGAGLIENIDGNILPKDSATRALVAMVLYGFYA